MSAKRAKVLSDHLIFETGDKGHRVEAAILLESMAAKIELVRTLAERLLRLGQIYQTNGSPLQAEVLSREIPKFVAILEDTDK
jgi:hypothetical protein